jgi:uncharacterized membrane protein affecting hemolysin expression
MILSKVPINADVLLFTQHKISQHFNNKYNQITLDCVRVVILTRKRVVHSHILIQHRSKGIKTHDLTGILKQPRLNFLLCMYACML